MASAGIARCFVAALPPGVDRHPWEDLPDLAARLQERWEEARSSWPGAVLTPETFAWYIGSRWPTAATPDVMFRAFHTTDLYLAASFLTGCPRAAALLEQRVLARVPALVAHMSLTGAQRLAVEDLVREKLLLPSAATGQPGLCAYAGAGPLIEWLRVTAVRTALKLVNRVEHRRRGDEDQALLQVGADPELGYVKGLDQVAFMAAVKETLAEIPARDRTLLRMHYLDGCSLAEIAVVLGLGSAATVSRRLRTAREAVAAGTRRRLRARLGLDQRSLDSLIGFLNSQLAVGLSSLNS